MGLVEARIKKRIRKENIRHAILSTIATAGILTVALAAPNVLQLLKYGSGARSQHTSRIKRSFNSLTSRGFIKYVSSDKKSHIELTTKGELLLIKLSSGSAKLKKPPKWDSRWRIVIFDIPEKRKLSRDNLRLMLSSLGFLKLQGSVWVYPYECEDLLNLIKTDARLQKEVVYIVAEEIENDHIWRKKFGLPVI